MSDNKYLNPEFRSRDINGVRVGGEFFGRVEEFEALVVRLYTETVSEDATRAFDDALEVLRQGYASGRKGSWA